MFNPAKLLDDNRFYLGLWLRLDAGIGYLFLPADTFAIILYQNIGHYSFGNLMVLFTFVADVNLTLREMIILKNRTMSDLSTISRQTVIILGGHQDATIIKEQEPVEIFHSICRNRKIPSPSCHHWGS